MSSIVKGLCFAVKSIDSVLDITEDYQKMTIADEALAKAYKFSFGSRLVLLALKSISEFANYKGASLTNLGRIKYFECTGSCVTVVSQCYKEYAEGREGFSEMLKRGNLLPAVFSLMSSVAESDLIQERKHLAIAQKKDSVKVEIYDGHAKVIGYKVMNVEDCEIAIKKLERSLKVYTILETVSKKSVMKEINPYLLIIADEVERIYDDFQNPDMQALLPPPDLQPDGDAPLDNGGFQIAIPVMREMNPDPQPNNEARLDNEMNQQEMHEMNLNLVACPRIPTLLHDDDIFKKYECAIMHIPARFPVKDPTQHGTNPTYYEFSAIRRALSQDNHSPVTGELYNVTDIVVDAEAKREVDARLLYYQNVLKSHFDKGTHSNRWKYIIGISLVVLFASFFFSRYFMNDRNSMNRL